MFLDFIKKSLVPTTEELLNTPWESAAHYALWSAQTYYFVCHSTRLFSLAAARAPLADNPVHNRFLSHLKEEKGHENLSTHDIKFLGYDLKKLPELPTTQSLYQTQYYWIEHVSPYSFFGYLLALESLAVHVGPDVYARVHKAHGAKASSFLKVHTEEDVSHVKEVISWIEKMPSQEQERVKQNFLLSLRNYQNMLIEIKSLAMDLPAQNKSTAA